MYLSYFPSVLNILPNSVFLNAFSLFFANERDEVSDLYETREIRVIYILIYKTGRQRFLS
jgi:hypothetical protein